MRLAGLGGQKCGCIGANREETGDAGIEQAAETPLHIEGQAQNGIDAAEDEEGD